MKKAAWKRRVMQACKDAGTYQTFFDDTITALAEILEFRDAAKEQYKAGGGQTLVRHTNQGGATNQVKNPALVVWMDCNAQALQYWTALGLTAKSYKAMTGSLNVKAEVKGLEEALAELGI